MHAEIEVHVQPYSVEKGNSILHRLIAEFETGGWNHFRGAVHFAKQSGNYQELISAMGRFLESGASIDLTFGADVFGTHDFATERSAIEELLQSFERFAAFRLHLYHERYRTFHPKVYLFSREPHRALLIIGSSNWSEGGFFANVEANAYVVLDLAIGEHYECYKAVVQCFESFWQVAL